MKISMELKGVNGIAKKLKGLAEKYPDAAKRALLAEGLDIQAESVKLAPVDTGRLRASAYTRESESGNPEVRTGYGVDYAIHVHERTESRHVVGEAKFLEKPFDRARRGIFKRLADRIESEVG